MTGFYLYYSNRKYVISCIHRSTLRRHQWPRVRTVRPFDMIHRIIKVQILCSNLLVFIRYLASCVYSFVVMMMGHFGGQEKMSRRLVGTTIPLQSPPFCCCCLCLPAPVISRCVLSVCVILRCLHECRLLNRNRLKALELTVLQYVILKPVLAYTAAVLWSDEKFVSENVIEISFNYMYRYIQSFSLNLKRNGVSV